VELFAPVVSPQERDDFAALRAVRDALVTQKGYTFLLAHVRCHPRDVESAIAAGADGLNFYFGTSPESRQFNHGSDLSSLAATARSLLEDVRRNHPDLIVRFSGEDAFRTSLTDLYRVYDEVAPFVHRLGMPDTVGVATPAAVAERVAALSARYAPTPPRPLPRRPAACPSSMLPHRRGPGTATSTPPSAASANARHHPLTALMLFNRTSGS
jgi:homocitrate synthase